VIRNVYYGKLALLALACAPLSAADSSPSVERLAQYGLAPTTASLGAYLAELQPSPDRAQQARALIEQLGADSFAEREQAARELTRQVGIRPLLEEAIAADDFEIRWRAKKILDQSDEQGRLVLSTVLIVVHENKVGGLLEPLLAVASHCEGEAFIGLLRQAIASSVGPPDVPMLRENLHAADPERRALALSALDSASADEASRQALVLLADSSEVVQAAAARVLANHGRRECLPVLVKLLQSSDKSVRVQAIQTLRPLTGEHFGYTAYEPDDVRAAAVERWKSWLSASSATADLRIPLFGAPLELGRLLVCDHAQNLLLEFDSSGKELWRTSVGLQPWACLGLSNGHRLVGSYQDRAVVEYDEAGKEVWRVNGLPGGPTSIERLENGNTLMACTEGAQVVEVDPAKKTVWSASIDGRPVDARRLEDGNTLVALQHAQKVVEIDRAGKQVWELAGVGTAFSAQRLASGNTLVSSLSQKSVREYDRAGKVVWEKGSFTSPYTAQRLASGNTLVVDTTGITEIDPQGTVVARQALQNISRAWRY
jgi:hypothetical protein